MNIRTVVLSGLVLLASQAVGAQGFFLPANDLRLREDVTLLSDEGVLRLPVNEWPMLRQDVAAAVARVKPEDVEEPALRAALARVAAASADAADAQDWKIREVRLTAGQPGLLREYGTPGRENGELTTTGGASTDRYNITLSATGVIDASDGQDVRFDGSDISVRWGNWLLSANQIDRWWGPGKEGSLILSSNARPMPAMSIDRIRSEPFNVPVLRWLGPWRFSTFFGLMENGRADVDHPVFMGMRASFKPSSFFEFAVSRSAMFCGQGRQCSIETFGRVIVGRDNIGMRGLDDPDKEPGNQMAGFEARFVSPFKPLPIALYAQEIGEDNSSSGIPERYLGLFGGEMWFKLGTGSVLRAHVEYANTKVKWYNSEIEYDWAYRQAIFFGGYRYRGRNIGHTTDADSETSSIGLSLTTGEGHRWAVLARHGRLDRGGVADPYNPLTAGPSDYKAVQVNWDGQIRGYGLSMQLGHEEQTPTAAGEAKGFFGFVQWRKALQ